MEWNLTTILLLIWGVWNLITFFLMGTDKLIAKLDGWRISEATLLGTAFCMGAVGSLLGSKVFHHKTRKKKFIIGLPVALIFNIAVVAGIYYLMHR